MTELVTFIEEKECDVFMEGPGFQFKHVMVIVHAAKAKDVDVDSLRFHFGQRLDLSGNPFQLSATGIQKK